LVACRKKTDADMGLARQEKVIAEHQANNKKGGF